MSELKAKSGKEISEKAAISRGQDTACLNFAIFALNFVICISRTHATFAAVKERWGKLAILSRTNVLIHLFKRKICVFHLFRQHSNVNIYEIIRQ